MSHVNTIDSYLTQKGFAVSLGQRIKEERERLGLSQELFAKQLGISRSTQARYENGVTQPSAEYINAAHQAGADIDYLSSGRRGGMLNGVMVEDLSAYYLLVAICDVLNLDDKALSDLYLYCQALMANPHPSTYDNEKLYALIRAWLKTNPDLKLL